MTVSQEANASRSSRGAHFEDKLEKFLKALLRKGKIRSFEHLSNKSKKIFDGEFKPDYLVTKNNGRIVSLDGTTTARTDRLRSKQWDAYGTKMYYSEKGKKITSYAVVDEYDISAREKAEFLACKAKCRRPHSKLNDTVSLHELEKILES